MEQSPYTLCVLGCGTLGRAILHGFFAAPDRGCNVAVTACVTREESAKTLRELFPYVVVFCGKNLEACTAADVVVLGFKPHQLAAVLEANGMRAALAGKLVISILAGVRLDRLADTVASGASPTRIVRAMPNTACKIRESMTILCATQSLTRDDRMYTEGLFSCVGRSQWLDEKLMDAATALAGSGPAFVYTIIEALADGAVGLGVPRTEAVKMAAQMVQGAARMVLQTGQHTAELRDCVTTPGGCTIAGLHVLESNRLRATLVDGLRETTRVCAMLGNAIPKKE